MDRNTGTADHESPAGKGAKRVFIVCAFVVALLGATSLRAQDFVDPAPPAVAALPPMAAPEAQDDGKTRHHAEPRPLAAAAIVEDWPRFLGPRSDNVSRERPLRKRWGAGGPPLLWERERGSGYAAPSVFGDRLLLFHRAGDEEIVECLGRENGHLHWRTSNPTSYRDSFGYNNGPRATPVIDGDHVYTMGAQGFLQCLELTTGRPRWRRELCKEFAVPQDFFGVVSTPLVYGDLLIVHLGAPDGPCVLALEKNTGRIHWARTGRMGRGLLLTHRGRMGRRGRRAGVRPVARADRRAAGC